MQPHFSRTRSTYLPAVQLEGMTDGSAGANSGDEVGGRPCPHCDQPMYKRHCKYVCPQHGVIYDCADTFW
ncbi:hypothetical protein GCM10028856_16990 [Halopiger thermotolerans]